MRPSPKVLATLFENAPRFKERHVVVAARVVDHERHAGLTKEGAVEPERKAVRARLKVRVQDFADSSVLIGPAAPDASLAVSEHTEKIHDDALRRHPLLCVEHVSRDLWPIGQNALRPLPAR